MSLVNALLIIAYLLTNPPNLLYLSLYSEILEILMNHRPRANILIINGPNMSLLGKRESSLYGDKTLSQIIGELMSMANGMGVNLSHKQSNSEGKIVDAIHEAQKSEVDYIIINPAAYSHTSIAIRDALLAVEIPFIEVHMSNIHAREAFRHKSYLSDIAMGVILGFGANSYHLAFSALVNHLPQTEA